MCSIIPRINSFIAKLRRVSSWVFPILIMSLGASGAYAQAARVSVTINTVNNLACIDQFIFCGKADMMVRVELRQSDGKTISCPDTMPIANVDNIGPLPSCSGQLVSPPVDLIVTIFDVDEGKLPTTALIQSEIKLSQTGSGATLPWFRLNGTPQSINGPQAKISLTATATMVNPAFASNALSLSRSAIDPSLGDRTLASNSIVLGDGSGQPYPSGARVRFAVQAPSGAVTNLADLVVPATGFNLDWDGKINSQPMPAGIYTLSTTLLDTGQTISAPVTVTTVANTFEATNASADPWNSRAGPVTFAIRLSPRGSITQRIEGPSAAGSACTTSQLPIIVPDSTTGPLNAGNESLPVPVKAGNGRPLPDGNYCVRLTAKNVNGVLIGSRSVEINIASPTSLRLVATLDPAVPWILPTMTAADSMGVQQPIPAGSVFVEVRAVDDAGNPRPTGSITVRAIPFLIIPVPGMFITTQTCNATSVCRMQIGMPTLTRATDVIFDATATDLSSPSAMDPPPATATFPQRAAALVWLPQNRAGPVNVPVIGSTTMGFNTVDHNRTQDVAFHAATGIDLTIPAQALEFSEGISDVMKAFWGGDRFIGANSITGDSGQSIAFWVSRTAAVIDTEAANSGIPGWPLCHRTQFTPVPFADIQAVVHKVNCRDNADAGGFSAELEPGALGFVTWHEFHHAAYELADEYPPDGGYFETSTLPNVMKDANDCSQYGAEKLLCTQIGTTGWWRAAPNPDVMIDNTRENLDELRRAKLIQNICSTGGC